jgi:hypothetical protein
MDHTKDVFQLQIKLIDQSLSEQMSLIDGQLQTCSCVITLRVDEFLPGLDKFDLWFVSDNAIKDPRRTARGYSFCYPLHVIPSYLTLLSDPSAVTVMFRRSLDTGSELVSLALWKRQQIGRVEDLPPPSDVFGGFGSEHVT